MYDVFISSNSMYIIKLKITNVITFFFTLFNFIHSAKLAEVILKSSIISENNQHGLSLYNPWTYIHLENNTFEQNQYEAGVKILGGSADILINNNQ